MKIFFPTRKTIQDENELVYYDTDLGQTALDRNHPNYHYHIEQSKLY